MRPNRKSVFREVRDYVTIAMAMLFYCIGWTVFLLPNNITTGGVAGISSIVFWGLNIPIQYSYFTINAVLLVIALRVLGWRFCVKTVFGVTILTLALPVVQSLVGDKHLLADQPFMAAVIGACFCGTGLGLGLSSNGSTGGTDIVAAIINKYRDISLGRVIMFCDVIIITCSYIVLHDWERVIYGYVVLIIMSYCLDQVVNSMRRSVQFFIVSDRHEEISHAINSQVARGCTVIDAHGSYTGKQVKMLFVLAKKRQSATIFQLINDIDPAAFVSQSAVIGVYGQGFDHFKVRNHQSDAKKNEGESN